MRSAWLGVLLLTACASGAGSSADATVADRDAPPAATVGSADLPDSSVTTAAPSPSAATTDTTESGAVPEGFGTTRAVVTKVDGEQCEICLWLAETSEQRRRGLMFVTDLGRSDGMAFRYPKPDTRTFFMKNTVLPLSIAFFAADGSFLDSFDMEPCTTDRCPNYATPPDFLVAVEVLQGGLAQLGLVSGGRLELLDVPCTE